MLNSKISIFVIIEAEVVELNCKAQQTKKNFVKSQRIILPVSMTRDARTEVQSTEPQNAITYQEVLHHKT